MAKLRDRRERAHPDKTGEPNSFGRMMRKPETCSSKHIGIR